MSPAHPVSLRYSPPPCSSPEFFRTSAGQAPDVYPDICLHMALGISDCSWLSQDRAMALLSANGIQQKKAQGSGVCPRGLPAGLLPTPPPMLPSRSPKAFGDRNHPFLSCPVAGPRVTPQRGERFKDQLGVVLVSGPYSGPDSGLMVFVWLLGQ